jgi:DNA-binding NarL/FixJ family response regulator
VSDETPALKQEDEMRIIVADDHPIFRDGLTQILGRLFEEADVVEAGDVSELEAAISEIKAPDLLTLDLLFPGFNWQKDLERLRNALPLTPIAVISMVQDNAAVSRATEVGINGFISKSVQPDVLAESLLQVMDGEILVRRAGEQTDFGQPDSFTALRQLTGRQIDVLRLICRGKSNKEIARDLELSPYTVRVHVSAMMKTLGVNSRAGAAALATSNGFS